MRLHKAKWLFTAFVTLAASLAQAGTYTVVSIELVSAGTTTAGHASVSGLTGLWGASSSASMAGNGMSQDLQEANPHFRWVVKFTPGYVGEQPPLYAHCKLKMLGNSQGSAALFGPGYNWSQATSASSEVSAWPGLSDSASVFPNTGGYTASDAFTYGPAYHSLSDGEVYTGSFTLQNGEWTATADQYFYGSCLSSISIALHSNNPSNWGTTSCSFELKTYIYEIDGQAV